MSVSEWSGRPDERETSRFDPDGPGMCGNAAPAVLRGVVPPLCELRAGHDGWHESPDGARWTRDPAALPPSVAAPGRTPLPGDTEERDGGEALSDDLRRLLAAIIAHPKMPASERSYFGDGGCDRCPKALDAADAVIAAGFRLVSEDEATVDRVARALWGDFDGVVDGMTFDEASEKTREAYRGWARAAVRALREAGQ